MTKQLFPERRAYAFLLVTLLISVSWPTYAQWEQLPSLPEPNGGFISSALHGRLMIVGGTNWEGGAKNWLSAMHEFNPGEKKWRKLDNLRDGPVAYAVSAQAAGLDGLRRSMVVGGSDGKRALKKLTLFDGSKTTTQPLAALPDNLVIAAGGQAGNIIVIAGGTDDAANIAGCQRATHTIEREDSGWAVVKRADYPGKAFCVAASAVASNELFVFGGANWDAEKNTVVNTSEAYAFSVKTNTWREIKSLPFAVRGMAGVALDDERIYLAGGFKSDAEGFTSVAFIYNVKANSYTPAKALPYAASVGLLLLDGWVYCIGGEDKMKSRTDQFFRTSVQHLAEQ